MLCLNMACSFSEPIKDTETDLKKQLPSSDTLTACSPSANRRLLTKVFRSRTASHDVGVLSAVALKIAAREPHDSQLLHCLPIAEMTVYYGRHLIILKSQLRQFPCLRGTGARI